MLRPRQFRLGSGLMGIAVIGIACAAVKLLGQGSWVGHLLIGLGGPFLLVAIGLLLFPIPTDPPTRGVESANSDIDDP